MMKTILYKNIKYKSISDISRAYNIEPALIINRMKKGWSLDKSIETTVRKNTRCIIVNNIKYNSITELATFYKLPVKLVTRRLSAKWTAEESVGIVPRIKKPKWSAKKITINKIVYPSINAACIKYNLNYNKIIYRIKAGWPIGEAFELKPHTTKIKLAVYRKSIKKCITTSEQVKGKIYKIKNKINNKIYIGATCTCPKARFNQHKNTKSFLGSDIRYHGANNFSLKIIATSNNIKKLSKLERKYIIKYKSDKVGYNLIKGGYNKPKLKRIKYKNKFYTTHEAAIKLNISLNELNYRLQFNLPLNKTPLGKRKIVTYNNTTYESVSSLARTFNLDRKIVEYRLKNDIPLEIKAYGYRNGKLTENNNHAK